LRAGRESIWGWLEQRQDPTLLRDTQEAPVGMGVKEERAGQQSPRGCL